MSLQTMNKVVLAVIGITIIIGVSLVIISSDLSVTNSENNPEESIEKATENEPNSFTVGLGESIGFSERP